MDVLVVGLGGDGDGRWEGWGCRRDVCRERTLRLVVGSDCPAKDEQVAA